MSKFLHKDSYLSYVIIHGIKYLLCITLISVFTSTGSAEPPLNNGQMFYGVDYYPEHWDESMWENDARLMSEAGMNVVRLAEFAWSRLEPNEGSYDFEWLDRAIAIMGKYGIKVVVGTPTAAPPAWLVQKHPEILQKDAKGDIRPFGRRRHYCPNDPVFQDYTVRIVTRMAEHYKNNPGVIGWQICNEFGESMSAHCFCEDCQNAFRGWLKGKYGNLPTLNKLWGTVFWSQDYTDWGQVFAPTAEAPFEGRNPSQALDYYRFMSESFIKFQALQVKIIREINPQRFITHNYMSKGFFWIDYFNLAKDLDFPSWDNYPGFGNEVEPYGNGLAHDMTRGFKPGNFWVMEEQSGATGWNVSRAIPRPGQVRLWAYQSIAHGADGLVYFRWRSCRYGTEQYWHGILEHDSRLNRRYYEIKQMGEELQKVGNKFAGGKYEADVAIILPYEVRWAFNIQQLSRTFDYIQHVRSIYDALQKSGIGADILSTPQNLSNYKVVIAPAYNILDEEKAGKLKEYVQKGGILIVTLRSGVKDIHNIVTEKHLPGLLSGICGVTVSEYDVVDENQKNTIQWTGAGNSGKNYPISMWRENLELKNGTSLATYKNEYFAGETAVSCNKLGAGRAYYIGAGLPVEFYMDLFSGEIPELFSQDRWQLPDNVELTKRVKNADRYFFLLNHNASDVEVVLPREYIDTMSGKSLSGKLVLEQYGVRILQ